MKISSDPSTHRQREQQIMQHVEKLLADDRLRVETILGRRPVTAFVRDVARNDHAFELKRLMSEMNVPDRELMGRMPNGQTLDIALTRTQWFIFNQTVARIRVACMSPTRALIAGNEPEPMNAADVSRALTAMPPVSGSAPMTVVLVSTSGFTRDARETIEKRPGQTVIFVEPNEAGGWTATGPAETGALAELFDPEGEEQKRQRVRELIEDGKVELLTNGIVADKLASRTKLPVKLVEAIVQEYAKRNSGLSAKRLDGRMVLFRENEASIERGIEMPFWNTIREMIGHQGSPAKTLARLNMERVSLTQQRAGIYEFITDLEKKEAELTSKFEGATAQTQERIAAEIAELRTDVDRRQQLIVTIDKKLNIVKAGIHQLEMARQVSPEKLKDLGQAAVETEDLDSGLASLEQMNEEAEAITEAGAPTISDKTKSVLDELRAKHSAIEKINVNPRSAEEAKATAAPFPEATMPDAGGARPNKTSERRRAELESS